MVGFCPANRFITMAAVLIDPLSGEVLYSSAGHNPAILIRGNGNVELIKDSGLILGILKVASYEDRRVTLEDGDMLVLYSDGITEATREGQDEEFGENRLCRVLSANAHLPASQLVDVVLRARNYFTDGAPNFDDATLVIVRRGEPKGPRTWGTLDGSA
jgi:sigma-B regulation protein RsbU (phosphoserine phosphatase)